MTLRRPPLPSASAGHLLGSKACKFMLFGGGCCWELAIASLADAGGEMFKNNKLKMQIKGFA